MKKVVMVISMCYLLIVMMVSIICPEHQAGNYGGDYMEGFGDLIIFIGH